MVKNRSAMQEIQVRSLGQEDPLEKEMAYLKILARIIGDFFLTYMCQIFFLENTKYVLLLFPGSSDGKESVCNAGDPSSIPGSGRSPREGNGNPLQYSCLRNPMNRRAWWATIHKVTRVRGN